MIRKNIPEKVEEWGFIPLNRRLSIIEYDAWEEKSYGAQKCIKIEDLILNMVISFKKLARKKSKSGVELSIIRDRFIVTSGLSLGQKRNWESTPKCLWEDPILMKCRKSDRKAPAMEFE